MKAPAALNNRSRFGHAGLQRGFILEIAILLILVLGALAIFNLVTAPPETEQDRIARRQADFQRAHVISDPSTGCEYVSYNRGLSPRLDQKGQPICRK